MAANDSTVITMNAAYDGFGEQEGADDAKFDSPESTTDGATLGPLGDLKVKEEKKSMAPALKLSKAHKHKRDLGICSVGLLVGLYSIFYGFVSNLPC
jgi:hypothetical protein